MFTFNATILTMFQNFPRNNPSDFTQYNSEWPSFTFKPQKGNHIMFNIEEVRNNNRAGRLISSFVAHIAAMALVLIMVLGPSTASARRPPTPENFRVTATTAYTVTVAWNPPRNNSGNFNYHLSGAYGVTPAVLPNTATSHTFTRLHHGISIGSLSMQGMPADRRPRRSRRRPEPFLIRQRRQRGL